MVKESRVTHAKISNWAKIIRNSKMEEQKKKEEEKRRKDQEKIRSWKRRASLEKFKKNNMSLTQSKMDMNNVNGFLKDTKDRNQSSERSDLGGDCICCSILRESVRKQGITLTRRIEPCKSCPGRGQRFVSVLPCSRNSPLVQKIIK